MHKLRFFDTGLGRNSQHYCRDLIDGCNVENKFLIRWNLPLTLQSHEDNRRGRREAFVPTGEGIIFSGLDDAWPHNASDHFRFAGDELFAERFGVGIDVRPAPKFRPVDAKFGETIAGPNLSFASDRQTERVGIVGVAHFFVQALAREFAKARDHHRVFCLLARAFRHFRAIPNLLLD